MSTPPNRPRDLHAETASVLRRQARLFLRQYGRFDAGLRFERQAAAL